MEKKYKYDNKSIKSDCWVCHGTGRILVDEACSTQEVKPCETCKGTGIWTEDYYHLYYRGKNGRQECIDTDGLK